jgi:hypothetical protein
MIIIHRLNMVLVELDKATLEKNEINDKLVEQMRLTEVNLSF